MKKRMIWILLLAAACLLTGCGKKEEAAPAPTEALTLQQRVEAAAGDAKDLAPLSAEDLTDALGAEPEDVAEFVYLQETGFGGREILAVRAKDKEAADRLEEMMGHYLEQRREETWDYAPEAYKLLSQAKVARKNLLLVMISGKDAEKETELLLVGE